MMPLFLAGFALAGFIVPPVPDTPPDQLAQMFSANHVAIRIGLFLAMVGSGLLCFLFAAIAVELRRIEGCPSVLAYVQLVAGACSTLEFIFPLMIWQAAAYRAERGQQDVQMLNDLAWLPFLGITSTFIIQQLVIAAAIFRDRRERPMPRWLAYLNLWAAVGIAPAGFVVFAHNGPLAWNGVLAWWVVLVTFFVWLTAMGVELHRAAGRWDVNGNTATPSVEKLAQELAALRAELQTAGDSATVCQGDPVTS